MGPPVPNRQRREDEPEGFYESFWRSARWGGIEPNKDERSRLSAIVELLDGCRLGERPQILDLGCGRGWLTQALTSYGDVLGTDIVAASVARARALFPELRFEQTDIPGLTDSRGAESFDLVVSSEVLEHVKGDDKREFVGGIYRLLRPGGYAILTTPRGELWREWRRSRDWKQPVEEWISETELDRLARGVGFRVERRTRAHVYGITPPSRLFASDTFRSLSRWAPALAKLTYAWRIYQVVLLRRPKTTDKSG